MPTYCHEFATPIGRLLLVGDGERLSAVHFRRGPRAAARSPEWRRDAAPFASAIAQFEEYFAGARRRFDLQLAPEGTEFQRRVWDALLTIPYGTTTTYGALAARLGDRNASRAVGLANGANPLPIIVPCHRVIGADGSLTGFGGGLDVKRALLQLEGAPLALVRQGTLL